ncbi:MAG TPA: ABC transporter substrate-binding protein [Terriglobales bacterium]|nr:ABC transporter substrate-binding protein [Terriglobales bacterium]
MKKLLALLLVLSMLLAGCAPASGTGGAPETRTVTDDTGREIEVPGAIDRVVIISTMPLASVYCMVAGSGEKLVGLTPSSANAALHSFVVKIAPQVEDVSTKFAQGGTVNVEEVLALEPDVVFYNTNNAADCEAVTKLETAGVACVGFSTTIDDNNTVETFNSWVTLLGETLGEDLQAGEIVDYGRKVQSIVAERVAEIPEDARRSALILANYNQSAITAAGSTFGRYWLSAIGAVNVATEIAQPIAPVNLEQIYAWDPDVIFLNSFSGFTAEQVMASAAVEGHDWSGLAAVKSGEVYKMPLGMYYWFPPCSDSPLALLWMAKRLYPEQFSDIDLDQIVKDYYEEFYGLVLTGEDLATIYNPPAESAMATP